MKKVAALQEHNHTHAIKPLIHTLQSSRGSRLSLQLQDLTLHTLRKCQHGTGQSHTVDSKHLKLP